MSVTVYYAANVGELRKILDGVPDTARIMRRFADDTDPDLQDVLAPVTIELHWTERPSNAHIVKFGEVYT